MCEAIIPGKILSTASPAGNGRTDKGRLKMYYQDENGEICNDEQAGFADPGGRSALRAASRGNPRNLPCPTCGQPNRLTPADKRKGYQCDQCADRDEGMGD